jgi:hypothetical protein
MKILSTLVTMLTISVVVFGCAYNAKETELKSFITAHVEKIKPMEKEASLASWGAAISGKPEDYDKVSELTLKVRQVYSNPHWARKLKRTSVPSAAPFKEKRLPSMRLRKF